MQIWTSLKNIWPVNVSLINNVFSYLLWKVEHLEVSKKTFVTCILTTLSVHYVNEILTLKIIFAGPKRGRPCEGFSDPVCVCVCLSVCLSVCLAIKLQDLSLALRSHDQFEASHWMMDDGWWMVDNEWWMMDDGWWMDVGDVGDRCRRCRRCRRSM